MSDPTPTLDPKQTAIDQALRQSMAAPIPKLSKDFHQRLSRKLHQKSRPLHLFHRILLAGYGGVSAVTSVVVMHGQELGWVIIALMALAALATLGLARRLSSPGLQPSRNT